MEGAYLAASMGIRKSADADLVFTQCPDCQQSMPITALVCYGCGKVAEPKDMYACGSCHMPQSNRHRTLAGHAARQCRFAPVAGCGGSLERGGIKGENFGKQQYQMMKQVINLANQKRVKQIPFQGLDARIKGAKGGLN